MKSSKKLLLPLLLFALSVVSCSKSDDDKPSGGSHKIRMKAEASAGSSMYLIFYVDAAGESKQFTNVSGTSWDSGDLTYGSSVQAISFGAAATPKDASSTLKVQIYVDGKLEKESTASGTSLSASTTYYF
jgi:hypothetical protein